MALARRDDTVTNTIGTCIPGALVYYYENSPAYPNGALATVYSDLTGTPTANPQLADGFGHVVAYLEDSVLYTIVYHYPTGFDLIYPDQSVGGGGNGSSLTPFAGVPSGIKNGTNCVFTFAIPRAPASPPSVWCNFPLIYGLGFTYSWASGILTITYAVAPQPASGSLSSPDSLYVQGWY